MRGCVAESRLPTMDGLLEDVTQCYKRGKSILCYIHLEADLLFGNQLTQFGETVIDPLKSKSVFEDLACTVKTRKQRKKLYCTGNEVTTLF